MQVPSGSDAPTLKSHNGGNHPRPGILELCAGSATLSWVADQEGFFAIPVDYSRNKFQTKLPVTKMDLTSKDSVKICVELIRTGTIQVVTAAVPCGTASRAREIYIGPNGPKPLRSEAYPYGLPGLEGLDLTRVEIANVIYAHVHEILLVAESCDCLCLVENPKESLYYFLDEPIHLLERGWVDVIFQHCRWTHTRPMRAKWTRIRTNVRQLQVLSGSCEMNHKHLPWGKDDKGGFVSAGEAEYPVEMCEAIISVLKQVLIGRGYAFVEKPIQPVLVDASTHKRRRLAGGKQPRGTKLPELITEFKEVRQMLRSEAFQLNAKIIKPSSSLFLGNRGEQHSGFTAISEDVSCDFRHSVLDGELDSLIIPTDKLQEGESLGDLVTAGIYRSPEEFLAEALKMKHPVDLPGGIPDELLHSLYDLLSLSPEDVVKSRINSVRTLLKLAEENKASDENILKTLDPLSARVLKGKKLSTAQLLLEKWSYPDKDLVRDTVRGFDLTGMAPFSGVFDYSPKLPTMTETTLRERSNFHNSSMLSRCKSSGSQDLDHKFWKQNLQEVESGWLVGPFYTISELSKSIGGEVPHLTRRFPLEQSVKVRSIDDFLESSLNHLFGSHDKLTLLDTDSISSLVRLIERLITGGTDEIVFSTGHIKKLVIHPGWKGSLEVWKGKTKDLSQAYKQLSCSKGTRWASCILVWDPTTCNPAMFLQVTLPFGASSSVLHFNRWAKLLWFLGIKEMGLLWTCFFDDFPHIAPGATSSSAEAAASIILKITGWRVAEGEKDMDWAECFNALGVTFDIGRIFMASSTVGNKEGRIQNILPILERFISERFASTKDVESLRGKLQYVEAQVFGRTLKSALAVLQRYRGHGKRFTDIDIPRLEWIIDWLRQSKPRRISPPNNEPPLLLFTDGACEGFLDGGKATTTCGAVLLDRRDHTACIFGIVVNDALQQEWIKDGGGKKQLVTEAELLPVLIARKLWADRLAGSRLLTFVDSNPAKFALIRGTSDSKACENIIRCISIIDAGSVIWNWYSRVPSKSNLADDPSRLIFPESIGDFKVVKFEAPQPISLANGVWIDG